MEPKSEEEAHHQQEHTSTSTTTLNRSKELVWKLRRGISPVDGTDPHECLTTTAWKQGKWKTSLVPAQRKFFKLLDLERKIDQFLEHCKEQT